MQTDTLIAVKMPTELRDEARRQAEARDLNLSQFVRRAIRRELEQPSESPRP